MKHWCRELFREVRDFDAKQWGKELTHAVCHLLMMFLPLFGLGTKLHDWNAQWVWPDYKEEFATV